MHRILDVRRFLFRGFAAVLAGGLAAAAVPAAATPALTMDVSTGDVLYAQDATRPWFPASTTKLMTVLVALSAVRDHQIAMETPLVVSARAHMMPPSKMGFPVGTQVTLENALKMLMVPSANDIAITVAEGVAGSVEAFADDMNRMGAQLGLHESHFVNPNGLPDPDHYSSARDMALIARALYTQFPEQAQLFNLGALSLGGRIIGNHNNLLGRYPGVDGMKTGFTCSAGFNIVASGFRDGRRLVVIVFGAPSVGARSAKVAALLDRGFAGIDRPTGSIVALAASNAGAPPDMRNAVCHNRAGLIAQFDAEVANLDAPLLAPAGGLGLGLPALNPERAFLFSMRTAKPVEPMALKINSIPAPVFDPYPVHIGAERGYAGVVAQARAPHSAIGSEPQPATAAAYAEAPAGQPLQGVAGPLGIDANALPLRGRRANLTKPRSAKAKAARPVLKAAAEAPKTKVLADAGAKASKAIVRTPVRRTAPHRSVAKNAASKNAASKNAASKKAASKKVVAKPPPKKPAAAARAGGAKSAAQ